MFGFEALTDELGDISKYVDALWSQPQTVKERTIKGRHFAGPGAPENNVPQSVADREFRTINSLKSIAALSAYALEQAGSGRGMVLDATELVRNAGSANISIRVGVNPDSYQKIQDFEKFMMHESALDAMTSALKAGEINYGDIDQAFTSGNFTSLKTVVEKHVDPSRSSDSEVSLLMESEVYDAQMIVLHIGDDTAVDFSTDRKKAAIKIADTLIDRAGEITNPDNPVQGARDFKDKLKQENVYTRLLAQAALQPSLCRKMDAVLEEGHEGFEHAYANGRLNEGKLIEFLVEGDVDDLEISAAVLADKFNADAHKYAPMVSGFVSSIGAAINPDNPEIGRKTFLRSLGKGGIQKMLDATMDNTAEFEKAYNVLSAYGSQTALHKAMDAGLMIEELADQVKTGNYSAIIDKIYHPEMSGPSGMSLK